MLFGVLSLLMGHWIVFVAKICVKSSALSSRFYPCASKADFTSVAHTLVSRSNFLNSSLDREQVQTRHGSSYYCPEVSVHESEVHITTVTFNAFPVKCIKWCQSLFIFLNPFAVYYIYTDFLEIFIFLQGQESFASHESLEQLHRFIFVLGVTHVSYSFVAIALAMIKVGALLHCQCAF